MKVKEQAIKALENMDSSELMIIYDFILSFNSVVRTSPEKDNYKDRNKIEAYLKVRNSLKNCNVSMSEDILLAREDRV